jgi:hypothetical protein
VEGSHPRPDLERATDGIVTPHVYSEITDANNRAVSDIARSCVKMLRGYRRMLDLAPRPGDPGMLGIGTRGALRQEAIRANLKEYMEHLTETRKSLDDCVVHLGGYL